MDEPKTCNCCNGPKRDAEWFMIGFGGPNVPLEVYCSKECFNAHETRQCICAWEEDEIEMDDLEDCENW